MVNQCWSGSVWDRVVKSLGLLNVLEPLPGLLTNVLFSSVYHPHTFPNGCQIAQINQKSINSFFYHILSPGNLHQFKIGSIILCIEGSQGSFDGVDHVGVIERDQDWATRAKLPNVLCRVWVER